MSKSGRNLSKRAARQQRYANKQRYDSEDTLHGEFSQHTGQEHVPLPLKNHIDFLNVVIGTVRFPEDPVDQKSCRRPLYIWGKYFDDNGTLQAVDCFGSTTQVRYFPDQFSLGAELNHKIGGGKEQAIIKTEQLHYFRNHSSTFNASVFNKKIKGALSKQYFPDLILRRASGLLHNTGAHLDIGLFKRNRGYVRHGFVFNTIEQSDVVSDVFAAEVCDAPFEQKPLTIPGFLEQDEIDAICLISRHYSAFCCERKLPIIWPQIGAFKDWPDEFLQFVEPQNTALSLPWFQNHCDLLTGFSLQP